MDHDEEGNQESEKLINVEDSNVDIDIQDSPQQEQITEEAKLEEPKLVVDLDPQIEEILDYWKEVQMGNFALALLLPHQWVRMDAQGYTLMHYAVTYNNCEALKTLLRGGVGVDERSRLGQTPLTIVCNYGFMESAAILVEYGADVNAQDSYQFTPLMYAIKNAHTALVMWLLCHGASVQGLCDTNGCSPVHWASYNNNVLALRLMKAIGTDIALLDKSGHTPLARGMHNYAYGSVKFFVETYPNMAEELVLTGPSRSIRRMVMTTLQDLRLANIQIVRMLEKSVLTNWNTLVSTLFLILTTMIIFSLCSSEVFTYWNRSQMGFIMNIVYVIMLFYFGLSGVWFINRTTSNPNEGKAFRQRTLKPKEAQTTELEIQPQLETQTTLEITSALPPIPRRPRLVWYDRDITPDFLEGITIRQFLSISYKPVEAFIEGMTNIPTSYIPFSHQMADHAQEMEEIMSIVDPLWYLGFTVVHLVYFLFQTNRFVALHNIDWSRVCPTCLIYRPPRMEHCRHTGACVQDYHSYSHFYRKSINSTNHLFYMAFLTLQVVVYGVYVILFWSTYTQYCISSWYYTYPLEIIQLLIAREGVVVALSYMVVSTLMIFTLLQWVIEIYCIALNLTYHEMMNNERFNYLFQPATAKNGKIQMQWKPRFPNGIMFNLVDYLGNQLKYQKLV